MSFDGIIHIEWMSDFIDACYNEGIDLSGRWELGIEGAGLFLLGEGEIRPNGWYWPDHQLPYTRDVVITEQFKLPVTSLSGWVFREDSVVATISFEVDPAETYGEIIEIRFEDFTDENGNPTDPWSILYEPEED